MSSFAPLALASTSDWGPSPDVLPEHLASIPYASFRKTDRLGRSADFASRWYPRQWNRHGQDRTNETFTIDHDKKEEKSFTVMDTKAEKKKTGFRHTQRPRFHHRRVQEEDEKLAAAKKRGHGSSFNKRYQRLNRARWQGRKQRGPEVTFTASVKVQSDWKLLDQYEVAKMKELRVNLPEAEDLKWCGRLDKYNEAYDRCTAKNSKQLGSFADRSFYYEAALDDPVIQQMAEEGVGNVYATDAVLAHLMTATKHATPWDLVITFSMDTIFIDARKPQDFERLTVNANASTPPPDSTNPAAVNSKQALSAEATVINAAFSQQVLERPSAAGSSSTSAAGGSGAAAMGLEMQPNPFADDEGEAPGMTLASLAYRYRKWDLGDGFTLVSRSTLNAVDTKRGTPRLLTVHALNEFDTTAMSWRSVLDKQPGQVLAMELKNNNSKLTKWATRSLLGGADEMKIGFASRLNMRSPSHGHEVLNVKTFKPKELSKQLSLQLPNMWGIVRWLASLVRTQAKALQGDEDDEEYVAKFVLLKEPNHPLVSLYSVPADSFEDDEEGTGEGAGAGAGAGAGVAAGGDDDAAAAAWETL